MLLALPARVTRLEFQQSIFFPIDIDDQMRAIVFTLVWNFDARLPFFGQLPDTHCAYSRIFIRYNYSFAGGVFNFFYFEKLIRNENKLIGPSPPLLVKLLVNSIKIIE